MSDAIAAVPPAHRGIRGSHDERRLTAHWPTIKPAPAATAAPPPIKIKGRVLAEFADYDGQWAAIRARVDAMGITRHELDHLSGMQEGYSGKVLGPAQIKKFGKYSLGATLGGIGCKLLLVEDPDATAKIMARAQKRKLPLLQLKLLPAPDPAREP
jgi:hypothetical protein